MTITINVGSDAYKAMCRHWPDESREKTYDRIITEIFDITAMLLPGDSHIAGLAILVMNLPYVAETVVTRKDEAFTAVRTFLASATPAQKAQFRKTCMTIPGTTQRERMHWLLGER